MCPPDVEHIEVVLRVHTHNSVDRVVTAVCRHRVVRCAVGPQVLRDFRVPLEPVLLEVVAVIRNRVLLIERRPEPGYRVAPDIIQNLDGIGVCPQGAAVLIDRGHLNHIPLVAARSSLCQQRSCQVGLVHPMVDQHDSAAGLKTVVNSAGVPLIDVLTGRFRLSIRHGGIRVVDQKDVGASADHSAANTNRVIDPPR